jgi:hypothetical protein
MKNKLLLSLLILFVQEKQNLGKLSPENLSQTKEGTSDTNGKDTDENEESSETQDFLQIQKYLSEIKEKSVSFSDKIKN